MLQRPGARSPPLSATPMVAGWSGGDLRLPVPFLHLTAREEGAGCPVTSTAEGIGFAVVAAVLWGIDPFFAQRALRRGNPAQVVFWTLVVASILLLIAHAALMGLAPLGAVSGPTLTAFVLAGGANYLLGRIFYFCSIRDVGPARSVPLSSTYPLFAATFAVLGLGEIVTLRRALGILLIVVGTLCITTERVRL